MTKRKKISQREAVRNRQELRELRQWAIGLSVGGFALSAQTIWDGLELNDYAAGRTSLVTSLLDSHFVMLLPSVRNAERWRAVMVPIPPAR